MSKSHIPDKVKGIKHLNASKHIPWKRESVAKPQVGDMTTPVIICFEKSYFISVEQS